MKEKRETRREEDRPNGISFVLSFSFRGGGGQIPEAQTEREREREREMSPDRITVTPPHTAPGLALGLVGMHFPRRGAGGASR